MDGENGGVATFSYSIRRKEKPPVCQKQKELHSLRLWVFLSFLFRRSLTRPVTEFFLSSVSVLFPNCLFAWDSAGSRFVCGGQKGWSRCVRCRTASPGRLRMECVSPAQSVRASVPAPVGTSNQTHKRCRDSLICCCVSDTHFYHDVSSA